MVDPAVVQSRLQSIQEMLDILQRHRRKTLSEYIANRDAQLATEHALFLAIQSLLDLGSHILSDAQVSNIADYRDVIIKLGQTKVLPSHFADSIADMAGFRNRLIHEYQDIDPKKVHEFLQHRLDDFEEFMRHIRDHFSLA